MLVVMSVSVHQACGVRGHGGQESHLAGVQVPRSRIGELSCAELGVVILELGCKCLDRKRLT